MNTALTGILQILSPGVLLLMLGGTVIGLVAGALPGISATMAVALLVPFTRASVPVVDIAGGKVVIEPPAEVVGEPPHPAASAQAEAAGAGAAS